MRAAAWLVGALFAVPLLAGTPPEAALATDPAAVEAERHALRRELLVALNAARRAAKLAPLRGDQALDHAAQAHAEALLKALLAGRGPEAVGPIEDLIARERGIFLGVPPGVSGGSRPWHARERPVPAGGTLGGTTVGLAIVQNASSATAAIAAAQLQFEAVLHLNNYALAGFGVARDGGSPEPRSLWVICLTRYR
jgi:hypothetical protein